MGNKKGVNEKRIENKKKDVEKKRKEEIIDYGESVR